MDINKCLEAIEKEVKFIESCKKEIEELERKEQTEDIKIKIEQLKERERLSNKEMSIHKWGLKNYLKLIFLKEYITIKELEEIEHVLREVKMRKECEK